MTATPDREARGDATSRWVLACAACRLAVDDPGMAIIQGFVAIGPGRPRPSGLRIVHKIRCGDAVPPGTREWSWELTEFLGGSAGVREFAAIVRRHPPTDRSWQSLRRSLLRAAASARR